uniref:exodeoxyribonuclease III n=1 Tax=Pygocentrus nattereri TaxID=42514 RepID=A0AAR2KFP9_PYGNA
MASDKVKIISFNVKGLLNPVKRKKIISKMKKEQAHVVYLQETHLSDKEHKKLKGMGFTHLFFPSYKSGHRRGVAILVSSKLHFEKKMEMGDKEGRFILVQGKVEGQPVTLLNIYALPGSDFSFFQKITNIMVTKTEGILICGGDLNIHLQPKLDSSSGKTNEPKALHKKINTLFKEVGLIDIWRDLFPNRRDYTYYSAPHSHKDNIHSCGIGTIDLSDHAPIYLCVDLGIWTKNSIWRLNTSLLNDPCFKEQIKAEITNYLEFNDNGESPAILWDAAKAFLRGKIIAQMALMKKLKSQTLQNLENKLRELQQLHSSTLDSSIPQQMRLIKREISKIHSEEVAFTSVILKEGKNRMDCRSYRPMCFECGL